MRATAPLILIVIGLIYAFLDLKDDRKHHHKDFIKTDSLSKRSKFAITFPLAIALFFSPCVAIGSYFFVAGTRGWHGIVVVSAIYLSVTILGMVLMVNTALKGVKKLEWHFLERHEKLVTGVVLIMLGALIYFVEM
jgi:cadmium resistance protein CadD (predicted permease)